MDKKSLKETHPEILEFWDYDKNKDIEVYPEKIIYDNKNSTKVWWKCSNGENHSYFAPISSKIKGASCNICSGRVVLSGFNDLATTHPELIEEWDTEKNNELGLKITEVSKGSSKKAYWKCNNENHSYPRAIALKASKNVGCIYCSGRVVLSGFNDLATTHPELIKEWDTELNNELGLKITEVSKGSSKKAYWKCTNQHDHSYLISIDSKVNNTGCNICSGYIILKGFNDLFTLKPELEELWDYEKNTINPDEVSKGTQTEVYWKCINGKHDSYLMPVVNKVRRPTGCPYCSGKVVLKGFNDLATTHPEVLIEWDTEKNKIKPTEITYGSDKKVYWVCDKGHNYKMSVWKKVREKQGCPIEAGKVITDFNSLQSLYPEIAKTFHPTLNGQITPANVSKGSSKKYFWIGENCGHVYVKSVKSRVKGSACPYCTKSNTKLLTGFNDLATKFPKVAKEWDYEKNGDLTPSDVVSGASKIVYWKCKKNHSWKADIGNRTGRHSNCPYCAMTGTSQMEQELAKFIKAILPNEEIVVNSREIIKPQELDIYIPSKKVAIEFNGIYWHSEKAGKDKNYHVNKMNKCNENGIRLIQIWEDDWKNKNELVKTMLKHKLGVSDQDRIYARNTTIVKSLNNNDVRDFLNRNHLQGFKNSCKHIGLIDKNSNIVAVISYQFRKGQLFLERFATNAIVVGGFGKLLKELKFIAKNNNINEIVTFADYEISDGSLYKNSGFTFVGNTDPGYYYIVDGERKHRFNYRKDRFENDKNLLFEDNLTERELAELNGFIRVYNSGNIKFIITI